MHIKEVLIREGIPFRVFGDTFRVDQDYLYLDNMNITSLDGFHFCGKYLSLDHNLIHSLSNFTFSGKYLGLYDNKISKIDPSFGFHGDVIQLSDNPIGNGRVDNNKKFNYLFSTNSIEISGEIEERQEGIKVDDFLVPAIIAHSLVLIGYSVYFFFFHTCTAI